MEVEEIMQLIRQMRHNQRRLKHIPKAEIRKTCEEYEAKVDTIIEEYFEEKQKNKLF